MSSTPRSINEAAAAFDSLPGVGPRAALRYAYWLAAQPKDRIQQFARAVDGLTRGIQLCEICHMWSEHSRCDICSDGKRNNGTLCVVATSQDVNTIEDSGAFHGRYHVLGGLLDPIEGKTPETLQIPSLLKRLTDTATPITELILALDPDVTGDTTALYLMKRCEQLPISITRLARGLQHGAQIEYADGVTIADAMQNRRSMGKR